MTRKGRFNGHTKRQNRASSSKGGLARMALRTREDQRRDSAKGGEATRLRWIAIRAARTHPHASGTSAAPPPAPVPAPPPPAPTPPDRAPATNSQQKEPEGGLAPVTPAE